MSDPQRFSYKQPLNNRSGRSWVCIYLFFIPCSPLSLFTSAIVPHPNLYNSMLIWKHSILKVGRSRSLFDNTFVRRHGGKRALSVGKEILYCLPRDIITPRLCLYATRIFFSQRTVWFLYMAVNSVPHHWYSFQIITQYFHLRMKDNHMVGRFDATKNFNTSSIPL